MKIKDLNKIVDNILLFEAKKAIKEESQQYETYHIMMDNEPIATYATEEEANEELPKYQKSHPDKELIIEPGVYESHSDMIEKLDMMGQELETQENMENMNMDEMYEESCDECWDQKEGELPEGLDNYEAHEIDDIESSDMDDFGPTNPDNTFPDNEELQEEGSHMCSECGGQLNEEGMCMECGITESKHSCMECGGQLNEEGVCMECSGLMMENKKKRVLRLTENQLVSFISKIINESMKGDPGVPGIPGVTITKRAQKGSSKDNSSHMKDVQTKMKDYLKFDGNDNPEFPNPIGKGEKVARKNTQQQEDEIAKNLAGLQNLDFDVEPSQAWLDRQKKAIEGHSSMGNAAYTDKGDVKPSNDAKTDEPKQKTSNVIKNDKALNKLNKQVKDRAKDKKERVLYDKEAVPTKSGKLNEELNRMKNIVGYNKKTQ